VVGLSCDRRESPAQDGFLGSESGRMSGSTSIHDRVMDLATLGLQSLRTGVGASDALGLEVVEESAVAS